jgi:hypothetical protein
MGWKLTNGLDNLRQQVNARFPGRDTETDGTIGNADHQERTSGHNPDDTPGSLPAWNGDKDSNPEVRAWDMDHDLHDSEISAQELVDYIRHLEGVGSAIRYIIYKAKIYHVNNGFNPEPSSGHETHVHFEGAWTDEGDESDFDFRLDELGETMSVEHVRAFFQSAAKAVTDGEIADSTNRSDRGLVTTLWRFAYGLNEADQVGANLPPYEFNVINADVAALKAQTESGFAALSAQIAAITTPTVDVDALAARLESQLDLSSDEIKAALRDVLRNGVGA